MTHLRKMMLEELQSRNYAQNTIDRYIYAVEDLSRHFKRSPDRLGPQHIREYQAELFTKRKLASSTVTIYLAALRFFYFKTLKKSWNISETPYPRKALRLPTVLSQKEVVRLIDAAGTSYHRTLLMTLYATGQSTRCCLLRFVAQFRRTSAPRLPYIEFPQGSRPPQTRAASFRSLYRKRAGASRSSLHSLVDARFRYSTRTYRALETNFDRFNFATR